MHRKSLGFTLVELMIVVLIGVIILSFSYGSLIPVLQKRAIHQTAAELFRGLNEASLLAKNRLNPTLICATQVTDRCDAGSWNAGFAVFNSNLNQSTLSMQLIKMYDPAKMGVDIQAEAAEFTFSDAGFSLHSSSARFIICHPDFDDYWVELILDVSGVITKIEHLYTETHLCL